MRNLLKKCISLTILVSLCLQGLPVAVFAKDTFISESVERKLKGNGHFSNDGGKISVRDEETFIDEFDFFDSFLEKQNTLKAETLSEETTCVKLSDFVGKKLQSNTGTLEFVSSDDGTVILQITEGTYYGTVQVFEFSRATENSFSTLTRNLLSGYIPSYTYGTAITGELNTRGNWNIKFTNSFGASFINNEYKILSDPSIGEPEKPEKPTSHLFSLFGSGICLLGNTAYIHGTFESMESGKVLEEFDKIQWTSSNSSIAQVVKKPSCISDVANNTAAISFMEVEIYDVGNVIITGTADDGRTASVELEIEPKLHISAPNSIMGSGVVTCTVTLDNPNEEYLIRYMSNLNNTIESDMGAASIDSSSYSISDDGKSAAFIETISLIVQGNVNVVFTSMGGYKYSTAVSMNGKKVFQHPDDEWNFKNRSVSKIPLLPDDYNSLILGLSNSEKSGLDQKINSEQGGGLCYGFAATSFLASRDMLDLDSIQEGADSLYKISNSEEAQSIIGFYHAKQWTSDSQKVMSDFMSLSVQEQISRIISMAREPFVLSFGMSEVAHAIVGYDVEFGSWTYHGTTYDTRIVTYDSNYPWGTSNQKDIEGSYLYVNQGTDQWEIPNYYGFGASSKKSGYFRRAVKQADIFTSTDFGYLGTQWLRDNKHSDMLLTTDNATYTISGNSAGTEDGFGDGLFVYYDEGYSIGSNEYPVLNIQLDNSSTCKISPLDQDTSLDMTMQCDTYFFDVNSDTYSEISFDNSGEVACAGLDGKYEFDVTSDDTVLPWYILNVTGENASEISLKMVEEGMIISGDNLEDTTVIGSNSKETQKINFSTSEKTVLITESNGKITALEDTDHDGVYDQNAANQSISDCSVILSSDSYVYDGMEKKPEVSVLYGSQKLIEGSDYEVSYSNNVNAGNGSITIIGKGSYFGQIIRNFVINKASQNLLAEPYLFELPVNRVTGIRVSGIGNISYVSSNPNIAVVNRSGYIDGISIGTAIITVTASGDDNYESASVSFEITVVDVYLIDSGSCGSDALWNYYSDGTVRISGTGEMKLERTPSGHYNWDYYSANVKEVVIEEGITSIADYIFAIRGNYRDGKMSNAPVSIKIADSVTSIGRYAFYRCDKLEEVSIGAGLVSLGKYSFAYCPALKEIKVSSDNTKFISVDGTLYSKDMLVLYKVPHNGITTLTIPDGVKKIEADAVGDLDTLEEIHIPVSVKTIESEAFDGSNNIKRVYYDGSQNQWNQIEIGSSNDGFLKGTIYYGNEEDCMTTGWKSINGVWYYFDASGSMHTGWLLMDGTWYYMMPDGAMVTGWNIINGVWYYFDASGSMHTGWLLLDGTWYYMMPDGAMVIGWNIINGVWYYFDASGSMHTSWLLLDGTWYYMMPSGTMTIGWAFIGNVWYYFDGSGSMTVGWLQLGGMWYYLQESGNMVTGWQIIDGGNYYFNESGVWVN